MKIWKFLSKDSNRQMLLVLIALIVIQHKIVALIVTDCLALRVFDSVGLLDVLRGIVNLLRFGLVFYLGVKFLASFKEPSITITLCGLVVMALFADYLTVLNFINGIGAKDKRIQQAICSKSHDDGMTFDAKDLLFEEYEYYSDNNSWLPKAPITADSINIHYYRDNFLGDYTLKIRLKNVEALDALLAKDWEKYEFHVDEENPFLRKLENWYVYERGQQ